MESNRHIGWLGAVSVAVALGVGLAACDRGGPETTAKAPDATAASAVSGSGISTGTPTGGLAGTTTPGEMVGTSPPGAVAPASAPKSKY
ncbi:hypothetical protein [Piscinibacter sp.]|jgi:hypothetical protein|uniref:hypothetical protein n=1 Tax=Piscinibacter sp. TaxID=1903157 RepID=UPI002F40B507